MRGIISAPLARADRVLTRTTLLSICLSTLIGGAENVRAQTTSATVNGQITDSQGRVVPDVNIQVVNIDTAAVYPGKTNDTGIYVVLGIPPGRYRIVVRNHTRTWIDVPASNIRATTGIRIFGNPSLSLDPAGRIRVFGQGIGGSLLSLTKAPNPAPWTIMPVMQQFEGMGNPAGILDSGGGVHVFFRTGDALCELYGPPAGANQFYDHSRDPGGLPIAGDAFALTDSAGTIHIFARGTDGALLEFIKTPAAAVCNVQNHMALQNAAGVGAIAGNPCALLDSAANLHIFARAFDGNFVEFLKPPDPGGWQAVDLPRPTVNHHWPKRMQVDGILEDLSVPLSVSGKAIPHRPAPGTPIPLWIR